MSEVISAILAAVLMLVVLRLFMPSFESWEQPLVWGSLFAHFASAFAQVFVVRDVYGGGDLLGYHRSGVMLADLLREYPGEVGLRMLEMIFHQPEVLLPIPIMPGATGAMMAISGFILLFVNDSLYAACLVVGSFAFFGKLALYRVFRRELDPAFHKILLVACLWVPSVVFWSSGLLKESVAVAGLGAAIYGGHALASRRRFAAGLALLALGSVVAAVVKPYLLVPLGLAAGLWVYFDGPRPPERRRLRTIRVGNLVVGAAVAGLVIYGIGAAFPRFSPATIADEASKMQSAVESTAGGSDYEIGSADATTIGGQLSYAPLALVTAFFRPAPFEVRNPQMALNALETGTTTLLLFLALLRLGPGGFFRTILRSPILVFCAVYVIGLALGVGLATTNLGTLSRYRMPMIPFYAALVGVLGTRTRVRVLGTVP